MFNPDFNPEFRHLLFIEEDENGQFRIIDHYTIMQTFIGVILILGFNKMLIYSGVDIINYIWNALIPGNKWMDYVLIISGLTIIIAMFYVMNEIDLLINKSITKLKNTILEKDAKIKELEDKLASFDKILLKKNFYDTMDKVLETNQDNNTL